ncbi:Sodium- and chloride-dependent GABA transporter 1 [Coemansia erecta]|nr:Sodium- and chloride-dependent GABA transporter 1 [Coemansia sp. RSA 2618]KAJ2820970.1 Sodium- and chloride-dependent GABA transporter 1 [Coemansia erecta]
MSTPTESLSTLSSMSTLTETPANASPTVPMDPAIELAAVLNGSASASSAFAPAQAIGMGYPEPLHTSVPSYPQSQSGMADVSSGLQFPLTEICTGSTNHGFASAGIINPSSVTSPIAGVPFILTPTHERRVLRRHSRSAPHPYIPRQWDAHPVRRNSSSARLLTAPQKSSTCIIPAINQDGSYKCCANCMTAETPSWRRHPDTQELLCNACGLYLRLHRKSRPITIDDAGHIQVIRKNAAVHRDPINVPPEAYRASPVSQQTVLQQSPPINGYVLRTTSSLASLQDVGEYPVDLGFASQHSNEHYFIGQYPNSQYPNGQYTNGQYPQPRLIDDMIQMQITESRSELNAPLPAYSGGGWFHGLSTPISSASLTDALQSVKDETK